MPFITTGKLAIVTLISTIMVTSISYLITDNTNTIQAKDPKTVPSVEQHLAVSKSHIEKTFIKPVKQNISQVTKAKQKDYNPPQTSYFESDEIIQENYVEDEVIDENWEEMDDEKAYMEQKRLAYESMTEEEIATQQYINRFEEQLITAMGDVFLNETNNQLVELFTPENEQQNSPLMDLQCSTAVCRVALNVEDENAQFDIIDSISDNIDGIQKQVVDVVVKPDDSRFVTLYLVLVEQPNDPFNQ